MYVWQLRTAQSCKIHQPHLLPLCLFRAKPTPAEGICTKHKWKVGVAVLTACSLELAKFLVPGHGDCLSPATLLQALLLRFPSPAQAHTHTHRGLTQELAAVLGLHTSTVSGLSSCWLHRCLHPPNSQFPVPVNTWNSTYTHVCRIDTHALHYEKCLDVEFNKKDGWVVRCRAQPGKCFLCMALLLLFLLSWPVLFFMHVAFSFPFPAFGSSSRLHPNTFSWHPTVSCTTL